MAGVPLRITLPFDAACHHCATVELLEQHSEVGASSRLNARIVVATIESHVHRLVTAPTPSISNSFEDEIVVMLTGYLHRPNELVTQSVRQVVDLMPHARTGLGSAR
jgi:hypothetical protein